MFKFKFNSFRDISAALKIVDVAGHACKYFDTVLLPKSVKLCDILCLDFAVQSKNRGSNFCNSFL